MQILISVQKDGSTLMKVVTSSTMKVWVYFVNEKYLIKCHAKRLHIILVKVSWREGQSICESFGGHDIPEHTGSQVIAVRKSLGTTLLLYQKYIKRIQKP